MLVVAGDIGGTNARLRLARYDEAGLVTLADKTYRSGSYPGLAPIVVEFIDEFADQRPLAACFAVAGPVKDQQARVTNLPWVLETRALSSELNIANVRLINDFAAVGYGLIALGEDDVLELQPGQPDSRGVRALIGAGTGLGQAIVVPCGEKVEVLATEGGHVDFAPRNRIESQLLDYLWRDNQRVTYEMLLSGSGLVRLFEFIRDTQGAAPSSELTGTMQTIDPAAAISDFALSQRDPVAEEALDLFVSIYGAQAGNLALSTVPSGGLYIAGGIAPKILVKLRGPNFMNAFHDKPPMRHLLDDIPIRVVLNTQVGLMGATQLATTLR